MVKNMSYKIVVDSCCELPEGYRGREDIEFVPLGLEVGDYCIQDDEQFNQSEFLKKVAACSSCPKSSCPSPEIYMEAYRADAENIYVVTLSSRLSGSYNSAELGKKLYEENYGKKNIFIVDSRSASCGEAQIALLAEELEKSGETFEKITEELIRYREGMHTYFVLDNLDTLRKNGRLTGVKALVASTLNIKPVMGATKEGEIFQLGQAVGINKALKKMCDVVLKEVKNPESKRLMITHCNCRERAEFVISLLTEKTAFREVILLDTAGISSMYANNGGVIVTV